MRLMQGLDTVCRKRRGCDGAGVQAMLIALKIGSGTEMLSGASFSKLKPGTPNMPLYEYECTACHRHTEKIQKFSDPEITTCPHCGGALKRVISAPAFSLKGGGWYADGYGSAKSPAAASSEGGASEGSSTSATKDGPAAAPTAAPAAAAPAPAPAPASSASSDKK